TINVAEAGDYDVVIRSGAVGAGRTLSVSQCDEVLIDNFSVPNVADWGQFKIWSAGTVRLEPGLQKIRITVGNVDYMDLDWIHIGDFTGTLDPVDEEPQNPDPDPQNPVPQNPELSAGCGSSPGIQNGRININVDGTNRSYILRVPNNYNNTNPYRFIMAFHWRGGNANQVASGGN